MAWATDDRALGPAGSGGRRGARISRRSAAFREAFRILDRRIELFTALPVATLDQLALGNKIREIGKC